MVALKNGIIQNKDGHPFDRSTGTWENQNVEENSSVVKEDASNPNNQDTTTEKQTDTENKQTDNENKQTDATKEQTDAKTPNQNAENKQTDAKTKETPAKPPKPDDEILKTPAETPKPRKIYYNIDGKLVYVSVDDLAHFEEVIGKLFMGIPLDDDLIKKTKPILAEAHLQDGTKIFNDETKLSQLDDIMKHYRGKQISSFDDLLEFVLRKIR